MAFFSDILQKLKKPVDALKDFLTPKEKKAMEFKVGEGLTPEQRVKAEAVLKKPAPDKLAYVPELGYAPYKSPTKEMIAQLFGEGPRKSTIPEATKKVGSSIIQFGKDVLRATPRAAASLTLEAQGRRTMIPETKAERFLFGEEPLESITERIEKFPERAKAFGIQEPTAKKIAPFAVIGLTALDILPPLPGKAGLKGVAKKALSTKTVKEFAKAITKKEADQILKAGFKSVDDFFKVAKKPAAKASLKIVDELKTVASTKKELESLKFNPLAEAKTRGYKVTSISNTPLGKQKGFAYRIEKGMDKMYAKNEAEIADLIKPGSRAIPAKLQPITKDEIPKAIMDEAQSAKDFALSKINDQEWMSGASKVSQDMVRDHSKKSVQQIAKEKFDYLKYRAGMVDKDGYPLDKAAQSKLAEVTKPSIPKELESFVPQAQKHKDASSFIREISGDTYAPEYRNPIADYWRKKYIQPLSKESKAIFTTDVVAFERNLDDVLGPKYAKEQLANMSVRQKAEIVNGKKWTDKYAEMLDNNLFKFQNEFFKTAKATAPASPTAALKKAAIKSKHADPFELAKNPDYAKELRTAIGDKETILAHQDEFYAQPKRIKEGVFYHFSPDKKLTAEGLSGTAKRFDKQLGPGLYVGQDAQALKNFYGLDIRGGQTIRLEGNPKIFDLTNSYKSIDDAYKAAKKEFPKEKYPLGKWIQKQGYDGIKYFDPIATGEEYVIYNAGAFGIRPSEALKAVRNPNYKKVFDDAIKKGMSPTEAANYAVKNVAASDVAPELQLLAQKAAKAKNLDEFLKTEHPAFPAKKEFAFEQEKGISYITKDTKPHGVISVDSPILVPSEGIGKEVIDKAKVEQFKKRIAKGEKFPPIGVRYSKDKEGYFLEIVDGHHRLTAAQEMGIKEVPFVFDTKRSLTEFYNQAVGEVSKPTEMLKAALKKTSAVKESAKSISQLENESAVAELKSKFKNVEPKNVPVSEIRNFPSAEGREIIENAKKEILAGKKYPLVLEKITEGKNAGKYKVIDGNYRAQAYKELGIKEAPAITQSTAPIFEQGKPVTTSVVRQSQKGFESTDKFRGGTWYSTPESKSFDFATESPGQIGGNIKTEAILNIKKPLIIHNAGIEEGSFSVINDGYENYLPKLQRDLANMLHDTYTNFLDTEASKLGSGNKKFQESVRSILSANENTASEIDAVIKSTNTLDSATDLIISKGLKKEGYDALILENKYKGKVIDRHIFKFAEAEKVKPTAELKEILKGKPAAPAKAQEVISEYQKRIDTTPAKKAATPISKTLDDTYTAIIDRFHPITKLARKATELRPGENPELLARRYLGVQGIAESKLFWNTTRLTAEGNLEVTGPGLSKILKPAKNNIDDLRTLMIAERDIELSKRTLESGKKVIGTTPQKSKEVINALKQKYGTKGFEQISKTAQGIREWSRKALLDPLLDVGAISKEQYNTITKSNEFYVPFQRVFEELETHGFVPKKANIFSPKSVPVKKLKGSTKDIIDPFESMITNAYKVTDFVERARVGRSIANLRNVSPELADMIKPIKPKIVPVAKQGEELIFRPSFFTPEKNTMMVFENGKRKFYQVPEDVFKAVSGMMESDVGAIMKMLAFPARTLRAGATLTPEFMGRNPFRDQFTAFVFSKYGYVPGVDLVKGVFNTIGKTDLHGRWLAGGGAQSMLVSLDRVTSQATLAKVLGAKDIKGMVKNPLEALRILSEFGEKGTRVGAFGRAVKKGVSDLEAAFESRDITLDFARRGSQTRAVNMMVAFWNAQVQGLNKMVRAFRERPMQTTFKAASGITLPSVLLYLNNRNDPRYQELPQWQKDLFWIIPVGDKGPIIRIPKPFEVGVIFGTVPEHILTWIDKNDPEALTSVAKTLMESSAPGYIPTGLQPIIENVANYSFFRQRPIVSEGQQALPKEMQAGRYTSETAKEIGKLIKQSPAKIENLFMGYTGGLGQYALDASDKLLKTLGVVSPPSEPTKTLADQPFIRAFVAREPIGSGSESVNKFYKIYDESNATKAAVKGLAEEGKEQEAITYLRSHPAGFYTKGLNKVARTFSDLRKKRDAVLDSRDLTPEQKKRAVDALDKIMTEIARQTVELVESSNEKFHQ